MGKNLSYFLFLLWLCYLVVTSILLFTRGFLLSRTVQKENSTCLFPSEIPCTFGKSALLNNSDVFDETCSVDQKLSAILGEYNSASSVCLPSKARVILLIVDALRYDFADFDEKINNTLPYQNKLPAIHRLIKEYPKSSRLYKFIADPPTTTMQRLKALTTGSLPTFIDAGSNFATSEINEDNIIDQLVRSNSGVVFMGDDTWNALYPDRFVRNFPYPSFNVWDLDTVDNGVKHNLYLELNNSDWSLLIGHFLGVDHCGHRYGPNHPEMERKLTEINTVIEDVAQQLDDDTMLFVIGDHGMTVTGDHGGESVDEVTAALFVYSKRNLLNIGDQAESVKQIDLVPTLSTLLGVPVPFQNLGILILDCLPLAPENWRLVLFSLWANVQQVINYIKKYSENEGTFSEEILNDFHAKYSLLSGKIVSVNSEADFLAFSKDITIFLTDIRLMCEEVWVQFESFSMSRGLIFLFLSMNLVFVIADGIPVGSLPEIFMSPFILFSYSTIFLAGAFAAVLHYFEFTDNLTSGIFFATGSASQLMLVMLIVQNWEIISLHWYAKNLTEKIPNLICRVVLIFNLCGLFSNSYIIEESFLLLFLLVTVVLIGTLGIANTANDKVDNKRKSSAMKVLKRSKLKLFCIAVIVAALLRASKHFWRCREEQQWCFASALEFASIVTKTETTKAQWALTVICLAVFVFATKEWLRNCGNLNGYSLTVTFSKFLPTAIVVSIAGFWVLRRIPFDKNQANPLRSVNILAWTVYGLIAVGILTTIVKPLCVYIISSRETIQSEQNLIPRLFKKLKRSFTEEQASGEEIPVICGLGTVYSTVFVIIGVYLTLLFALLLGDGVAPSVVTMFMTAAFILIVTSLFRIEKAVAIDDLFHIPNIFVLIWIILSQYFFYGTGHQPTFPNISWEAAFIGTSGVFSNNFIPVALIVINTFCSHILMGVLLPMVFIAPFTIFVMIPSSVEKKNDFKTISSRGEVILFEKNDLMLTSMFTLSCKYIVGHGIRVFVSMLSATIHCRHLMVWKIFAPKLIFESIGMLVTLASVMAGYLILLRINKKVESLILALNKMS